MDFEFSTLKWMICTEGVQHPRVQHLKLELFSYFSPNGNKPLGAVGSGWAWNQHEEMAGAKAILSAAGLEMAKKQKRTFDRFDVCD